LLLFVGQRDARRPAFSIPADNAGQAQPLKRPGAVDRDGRGLAILELGHSAADFPQHPRIVARTEACARIGPPGAKKAWIAVFGAVVIPEV
jgi:hypothetical protein